MPPGVGRPHLPPNTSSFVPSSVVSTSSNVSNGTTTPSSDFSMRRPAQPISYYQPPSSHAPPRTTQSHQPHQIHQATSQLISQPTTQLTSQPTTQPTSQPLDGRGRGGPPPSKPASTRNYGRPPTTVGSGPPGRTMMSGSGPPAGGSMPSGPPTGGMPTSSAGPPLFHGGNGRYPPSTTSTSTSSASTSSTSSISSTTSSTATPITTPQSSSNNRPPASLTKPRTSRRPKPTKDSRIDPRQIPRPNLPSKEKNTTMNTLYATRTGKGLPPEDCGDYRAEDQGNVSPRMLRMTTNSIPRSKDMMTASKIPFRCHVRPFAPIEEGEQNVPILNFGEEGPPRCGRCNGFINPYVKFEDDGKVWKCNLCGVSNDVINPSYVCNLDAYGRRYDLDSRHELTKGCIDVSFCCFLFFVFILIWACACLPFSHFACVRLLTPIIPSLYYLSSLFSLTLALSSS